MLESFSCESGMLQIAIGASEIAYVVRPLPLDSLSFSQL